MEKTELTSMSISKALLEGLKQYKTFTKKHSLEQIIEQFLFNELAQWLFRVGEIQKEKDTEILQTTSKWLKEQLTIMMKNKPLRQKAFPILFDLVTH